MGTYRSGLSPQYVRGIKVKMVAAITRITGRFVPVVTEVPEHRVMAPGDCLMVPHHYEARVSYAPPVTDDGEKAPVEVLATEGKTSREALQALMVRVYKRVSVPVPRCAIHCSGMREYVTCGRKLGHVGSHNFNNQIGWPQE